jgi:hypothetical protein
MMNTTQTGLQLGNEAYYCRCDHAAKNTDCNCHACIHQFQLSELATANCFDPNFDRALLSELLYESRCNIVIDLVDKQTNVGSILHAEKIYTQRLLGNSINVFDEKKAVFYVDHKSPNFDPDRAQRSEIQTSTAEIARYSATFATFFLLAKPFIDRFC